jgi:hypothetical protein
MTTASSSCGGAGDVTVVLVDARNVLRSVWPNIPEADALQRSRGASRRTAVPRRRHRILER